ncbi:MAG: ribosome assembly cofactor RimP [Luteibaculum sp.]
MISQNAILEVIEPKLKELDLFLVDLHIGNGNQIRIEVDSLGPFNVDHCVKINRCFEAAFDREDEDYALEVSSPGLDQGFKVWPQYQKNVGREVEIILNNGEKRVGMLIKAENQKIELEKTERKKIEGTKKKEWVTTRSEFELKDIKKATVKLSF